MPRRYARKCRQQGRDIFIHRHLARNRVVNFRESENESALKSARKTPEAEEEEEEEESTCINSSLTSHFRYRRMSFPDRWMEAVAEQTTTARTSGTEQISRAMHSAPSARSAFKTSGFRLSPRDDASAVTSAGHLNAVTSRASVSRRYPDGRAATRPQQTSLSSAGEPQRRWRGSFQGIKFSRGGASAVPSPPAPRPRRLPPSVTIPSSATCLISFGFRRKAARRWLA